MVEIYDTHEQGERVKGWLRENGGSILMGLVLAFGGLFGFKQWQLWQVNKSRQAAAEYQTMADYLAEDQLDAAVANYETLKTEYPSSAYLPLANLQMAAARIDAGQPELATALLEQAMNEGEPEPLRVIARTRLARLKLDLGDPEGAMELLDGAASEAGFESRFAEIRGDIYRAQGETGRAIEEYRKALELQETGIGYRPLLEMKLEALGAAMPEATS